MPLSAIMSALHLLGFAVAMTSVWNRGRAMSNRDVQGILRADTWWGIGGLTLLITGLTRAFGGLEKGTAYYLGSSWFHLKMGLFVTIILLEIWPMVTFIRWRMGMAKGVAPDTSTLHPLRRINQLQLLLMLNLPFVAAILARGGL